MAGGRPLEIRYNDLEKLINQLKTSLDFIEECDDIFYDENFIKPVFKIYAGDIQALFKEVKYAKNLIKNR